MLGEDHSVPVILTSNHGVYQNCFTTYYFLLMGALCLVTTIK